MNNRSTLAEIDRLEGIAQAYKRRRPSMPMQRVIEDCNLARQLASNFRLWRIDVDAGSERIAELEADLVDARNDLAGSVGEWRKAKLELDKLMASLSARLER